MAKATQKKTVKKNSAKKTSTKHKKAAKKTGIKKNKLGVKNSLVNNINAKKKKGTSRSKKSSTISSESYKNMENNWGKDK